MPVTTISKYNGSQKKHVPLIPAEVRRVGMRLFDQQMWCWGQDIRHVCGNLLIEYGLTRMPPQCERRAQSCYDWVSCHRQMRLWGFAVWLSHERLGTVLIRRSDFRPQFAMSSYPAPLVWRPDDLPELGHSLGEVKIDQARLLLADLFEWIEGYERWVVERIGVAGRQAIIDAWPQRRKGITAAAEEMAEAWYLLVQRVISAEGM